MKKKILVHIGLHKTGTSAVQLALNNNRRLLKDFGFLYPVAGCHYYWGQHNLAWEILAHPMYDPSKSGWKEFFREVESFEGSVVLSAEAFSTFSLVHIEELKKRLKDFDVEILLYLRGQVEWLQSFWCELAKGRQNAIEVPDLDSWVLSVARSPDVFPSSPAGKRLGDFSVMLENWTSVFSHDSVTVRSFEKSIKGDLVEDFLSDLGVSDITRFNMPDRVNDKVDIKKLNLIRLARSILREKGLCENGIEEFKRFLMSYDGLNSTANGIHMQESTVKSVVDRYGCGNSKVIEEFFLGEEVLPTKNMGKVFVTVQDYTLDEVSRLVSEMHFNRSSHKENYFIKSIRKILKGTEG